MGDKNNHRQVILLHPTAGVSSSSKVPLLPLPKHPVSPSHPRQVQGEVPACCPMGLQQEPNIQPAVLTSLQCPATAQLRVPHRSHCPPVHPALLPTALLLLCTLPILPHPHIEHHLLPLQGNRGVWKQTASSAYSRAQLLF